MEKQKILIIEDDPFIYEMYSTKFEHAGYTVDVATTGKDGLERIREWKPDVVLLDVLIPEMDGFEVLEAAKKDQDIKDVPVMMLTNLGQKEDIERGKKLGAASYIVKAHFTPQEVVNKVKAILGEGAKG